MEDKADEALAKSRDDSDAIVVAREPKLRQGLRKLELDDAVRHNASGRPDFGNSSMQAVKSRERPSRAQKAIRRADLHHLTRIEYDDLIGGPDILRAILRHRK